MKCDHIRTRAQGDTPFFPNMLNNANVEVCLKEDVDEAIAELKAANKLLKEHIANGDVSRITWIDEVIELKQKLRDHCTTCPVKEQEEDVVADLKAENERLKATPEEIMKEVFDKVLIYPPDMVRLQDAYRLAVSLRKAKRALWLARSERALAERRRYCAMSAFEDIENDALRIKWCKIQHECLKKAEEYR